MSIARFHHDWRARFAAFVTLTTFLASLLPARTAHADDGTETSAPEIAGLSDGSAGLSTATGGGADSSTGDARTSYTFKLPRARGDAQPSLGLTYSSSSGVGFAGVGWTLSLPSIVRKGVAGVPKFRDEVPTNGTSDDFYIDGALLLPVQTNPPLPAAIPAVPNHPWVLYRREIDDGSRYFYDGLTWVQQSKAGLRQFGTPLDGGTPSMETVDAFTGNAFPAVPGGIGGGDALSTTQDRYVYRWNLVRDTDASGNTVYYVWDYEFQLLGVNPRTAGTMFLTDIYDTSNTPNPTPPGPPGPAQCSAPSGTQACGNCGTQTGTCANGVWTWGQCEDEGVCSAGTLQACGTGGVQGCNSQCQWDSCVGQLCPGETWDGGATTEQCGTNGCGVSVGTCDNGTWSWGACQTNPNACTPGTTQSCGAGMTETCTSACSWGACTCTQGATLPCSVGACPGTETCAANGTWGACQQTDSSCCTPPATATCYVQTSGGACPGTWTCGSNDRWGTCQQPQGSCIPGQTAACTGPLGAGTWTCTQNCTWPTSCPGPTGMLDDFLGLFEGTAHAQTGGGGSPTAFAHHTHLTWALPTFLEYPTAVTVQPGLVGPYAFSPIWKAPPFAQLTTVDVFSATATTDRQLVREYQLKYAPNRTETRSYLTSIQLVGDCDSVGGISESQMPGAIAACAANEAFPPTTFSYYGIDANLDTDYSGDGPNILSETEAYTATAAAAFLVDLNGDAIDDLVCGNNGAGDVTACLNRFESEGVRQVCPMNTGDAIGNALTFGLYDPQRACNCPTTTSSVNGPSQSAGTSFSTSSNGSLTAYAADDSMWSFSIFADWAATGRTNFLQVLPLLPLQNLLGGGYSNSSPAPLMLNQLSDPSPQATLQNLSGQISSADANWIESVVEANAPQNCRYHDSNGAPECNGTDAAPYNAMDVDGDGLPDMVALNSGPNTPANLIGGYWPDTAMFSTRDRNGVTHPFAAQSFHTTSKWELPSWGWDEPGWGGSGGPHVQGGTYLALTHTGSGWPGDPITPYAQFTSAVHAGADIDGDGLADEVIANKFRDNWNQTMYESTRVVWDSSPDEGYYDGAFNFVGLVVLPNRGDGRFGVPGDGAYVPSPELAFPYDWGNYVTPGATAPFMPYSYPMGGGMPPYNDVGPAPPTMQSDNIDLGTPSGYSMQGSVIRFGDLNGDGMADYAVLDGYGLHICLRYGGPWDAAHWRCTTAESNYTGNNQADVTQPHATIMIGDVNGSGINRVIYFPAPTAPLDKPASGATAFLMSPDGSTTNSTTNRPRDGLLQTVSNGLGGQTTYTYATVNSLGIGHIPVPAWVVTSATTTNGLTGTQAVERTTQYSYGQPIYDARAQMFVGFRSVTAATSDAGGASPGLTTKTTFATQTDNTCAGLICAGVAEAMIHASRYLPAVVETSETVDGAVTRRFSTTVYSYAYQNAYTALDGAITGESQPARPGMTLSKRTTLTYPWNKGDLGNSQFIAPTLTFMDPPSAEGQLGVDAAFMFPSGGNVIKHQSSFDVSTGNEVLAQDFGVAVAGYDVPIIRQATWELPPGDQTGWDYRVQQTLTGYALPSDPTGATLDTSKPYREHDFTYDAAGRVLTVKSPLNNGVPLPGPGGGAFAAGQPPTAAANGALITLQSFQYDQFGNVTQSGSQDYPCVSTVGYDTVFSQLPETVTVFPNGCGNPGGLVTNLTFDRRLDAEKSSMDPSGSLTVHSYDDFGRVVEIDKPAIDMPGATTQVFTAQYTDSPLVSLVHSRTGFGPDSGSTTASGYLDHYQYIDGLGETRATVDAVDPNAYLGTQWVISGVHTSYLNGRVASTYRQFGSTSGPAAAGSLPPEVSSPEGGSAAVSYDGIGRVTYSTDYLGNASTATYYDANLQTTYVDPQQATDGSYKAVTKDGHGRVISQSVHLTNGPSGSNGTLTTQTAYQATSEVASVEQFFPGGHFLRTMTYDSLGRLVQNTEPNVGTWTYAYDAEGHLVGAADARGCGQNIFYDALGRVLARDYSPCTDTQDDYSAISGVGGTTFPYPGAEVSYSYDSAGRLLAVADRARSDSYTYHSAGPLQQIVRELAGPDNGGAPVYGPPHTKTFDSYTVDGKLTNSTITSSALANPAGSAVTETTTYTTDGQLYQVGSSLSGSIIAQQLYYSDGSLASTQFGDPALTRTFSEYDDNGSRIVYAIYRMGVGPWVTNYAPGFGPPPNGDPSLIQTLTSLSYTRDKVGNPTYMTENATAGWPAGAQATTIQASYYSDYRLRQASVSPPDSYTSPYAYEDSIGSDEYPEPTTPSTNARWQALAMSYDWRGNATTSGDDATDFFDRSLGTVTSSADRLSSATGANGESLTTQYDAAGNLTQIVVNDGNPTESKYDYEWDEVGNLAYAARQLGGGISPNLHESYQYTDDGQRVLASSQVSGGFIMGMAPTYTVNVFDSQVLKNAYYDTTAGDYVDSVTTEQVYSAAGLARVFYDSTNAMPQVAGSKYASPSIHTFLNLRSYNGSGAFVLDQDTSELVERTAYMPYGAVDADWRPSRWQGSREDIKYTGQWDEAQVGLVYMGARYYSPQLGRFISPDPLAIHALGADLNPYEYANGNPLAYTDPTGLLGNCDNGGCPAGSSDEWAPKPATFDDWQFPQTDITALAQGTLAASGSGNAGGGGIQLGGCGEGGCASDFNWTVEPDFGSENVPSWMGAPVHDMSAVSSGVLDVTEEYNQNAYPGNEVSLTTEQLASIIDVRNQAARDAFIQDQGTVNLAVTVLGSIPTLFGGAFARDAAPAMPILQPGQLPPEEERALLDTLAHIDAGTVPTGATARRWGVPFNNNAGDLPGVPGARPTPYTEFRVAPGPGVSGAGLRRIVVDNASGRMYYSWTHYGQSGTPAFVLFRWW